MKRWILISALCVAGLVCGCATKAVQPGLYRYLAIPPENWIQTYGDADPEGLIYNIAELRAIQAHIAQRLVAVEQRLPDPNTPSKEIK